MYSVLPPRPYYFLQCIHFTQIDIVPSPKSNMTPSTAQLFPYVQRAQILTAASFFTKKWTLAEEKERLLNKHTIAGIAILRLLQTTVGSAWAPLGSTKSLGSTNSKKDCSVQPYI
jgi:hypothetical protein